MVRHKAACCGSGNCPLVLIGVGDYDGNFRYFNRAYRNVLGWSRKR
jgi:PAS domain-containing protein